MDTEDFVTYEQAVALKELGFNVRCLYYYNANAQLVANERDYQEEVSVKDLYTSYNNEYTSYNRIDAPTLAQAQKWLYKKFRYYVYADPCVCDHDKFLWHLSEMSQTKEDEYSEEIYNSPEAALSGGITKLINIQHGYNRIES